MQICSCQIGYLIPLYTRVITALYTEGWLAGYLYGNDEEWQDPCGWMYCQVH